MDYTTDQLQLKINAARADLPKESREAIDAISWRTILPGLHEKYSSEQLENLETETELMLCGLILPEDFYKGLTSRMKISATEADLLVRGMDRLIFKKMEEVLEKKLQEKDAAVSTLGAKPAAILAEELRASFQKVTGTGAPAGQKDFLKDLRETLNKGIAKQ